MIKASVTNQGEHIVHRIGFSFAPGETVEVEVLNARQLLALQAVRVLATEVQEPLAAAIPEPTEPIEAEVKPAAKPKTTRKKN